MAVRSLLCVTIDHGLEGVVDFCGCVCSGIEI